MTRVLHVLHAGSPCSLLKCVLCVWLALAGSADAQPASLTFTASSNHATVTPEGIAWLDRYDLVLQPQGQPALGPLGLGKPQPVADVITLDVTATLASLSPGTYTARVVSVGPGGVVPSEPSPPFVIVQTTPSVPINTNFSVVATHDGVNTEGYRVFLDGVKVGADVPVSALVSGAITFAGLRVTTCATHNVQVAAYSGASEVRSALLIFPGTGCAPTAPTGLRIIVGG